MYQGEQCYLHWESMWRVEIRRMVALWEMWPNDKLLLAKRPFPLAGRTEVCVREYQERACSLDITMQAVP